MSWHLAPLIPFALARTIFPLAVDLGDGGTVVGSQVVYSLLRNAIADGIVLGNEMSDY